MTLETRPVRHRLRSLFAAALLLGACGGDGADRDLPGEATPARAARAGGNGRPAPELEDPTPEPRARPPERPHPESGSPTPEPGSPTPESGGPTPEPGRPTPASDAPPLAIDTHIDTTQRLLDARDDIAERMPDGHVDFPRMREGGLGGAFFSIWVSPTRFRGEARWRRALALIDAVEQLVARHPEEAALCTTAREVRAAHAAGKLAILMGVEGAHALGEPEDDDAWLARVAHLHGRGVRYMTLTWTNDNALAHASARRGEPEGLTPLGRRVVAHMNTLGMIVDVSHVSDQTFWDVLEVSTKPVFASHSSVRALADHHRNLSDPMIRALAERGGAVCINYYTQFIDRRYARRRRRLEREHRDAFSAVRAEHDHSWQRWGPVNRLARRLAPELHRPILDVLVAHFAHAARVGSPDAVCLGSDFDGVGELPRGLDDAAGLPALRQALGEAGLPIPAIFGENVLRILEANTGA